MTSDKTAARAGSGRLHTWHTSVRLSKSNEAASKQHNSLLMALSRAASRADREAVHVPICHVVRDGTMPALRAVPQTQTLIN